MPSNPRKELRNFVSFELDSSALDDGVFDEAGNPIVPPGRGIAEGLAAGLRSRGFDVSAVFQRDYYGWECFASRERGTMLLLLQYPGPWHLFGRIRRSFLDKM